MLDPQELSSLPPMCPIFQEPCFCATSEGSWTPDRPPRESVTICLKRSSTPK